jgi:hypothetical protein
MNQNYQHTQLGKLMIYVLSASFVFAAASILIAGAPVAMLLYFIVTYAIILALFGWMTVQVANGRLSWRFGIGLFNGSVALNEIATVEPVRNPWYYGWGVHLTPDGWLYNVSGTEALRVTLTNGRKFRLGTDEPQRLLDALREAQSA